MMLLLALVSAASLVAVLVLISHTMRLSDRMERLERKVKTLAAVQQPASVERPPSVPQQPAAEPLAAAHPPAFAHERRPHEEHYKDQAPSRTRQEWEQLIGGKVLNRIGALALIIALGSFMKYAFENNWISETVRVLIGAGFGVFCLAGGYKTNQRGFQVFAQGIVGAGIAILYLSVYAAFNFFHLLSQPAAFLLMLVVTIVAFANALYYDSPAEAVLGWAGGFLTPMMLSTGSASEMGLFGYLVLLDAGLIAIALRKRQWFILEPLTLIGTWVTYALWFEQYYHDADLAITVVFVTLFWILFLVLDVLSARSAESADPIRQIVPGLNAGIFFIALYSLLDRHHHEWMGLVTLAVGCVYAAIALGRSRFGPVDGKVRTRYGLTAVTLAVAATAIQFSGFQTVMLWSAEAVLLMWCSKRWDLRPLQSGGVTLFVLAGVKLVVFTDAAIEFTPIASFLPVLNIRAATFAVYAASLWSASKFIAAPDTDAQQRLAAAFHYACIATVFILLTAETSDLFRRDIEPLTQQAGIAAAYEAADRLTNLKQMSLSAIWLLYSGMLMGVGLLRKYRELRLAAIVLFGISVVKAFIYDLSFLETLYRIYSFMALGVLLLAVSYAYQKYKDVILEKV